MPLFLNGVIAIAEVTKNAAINNSFYKATGVIATGTGEFMEIMLNSWVDCERGIVMPREDDVLLVEGKLTYDVDKKQFVLEVTRSLTLRNEIEPFPPRITGTGIFQVKKGNDELHLTAHCFASGIACDQVQLMTKFQMAQYLNFVGKLQPNREIFVSGVLSTAQPDTGVISTTYTDFSYLARADGKSSGDAKKKRIVWPTKPKGNASKKFASDSAVNFNQKVPPSPLLSVHGSSKNESHDELFNDGVDNEFFSKNEDNNEFMYPVKLETVDEVATTWASPSVK